VDRNYHSLFGYKKNIQPLSRPQFLTKYKGQKVVDFQKAFLEIDTNILNDNYVKSVAELSCFTKSEAQCVLPDGTKDPRFISSRSPEFNALNGPTLLAASKHLAHIWRNTPNPSSDDDFTCPLLIYATGMDANAMGRSFDINKAHVDSFPGKTVSIEDDYSRYDCHWRTHHYQMMFDLLERFMDVEDGWRLSQKYVLKSDGKMKRTNIKFVVHETVHSGEYSTSLYNTILTALMHLFDFAKSQNNFNVQELLDMPYRSFALGDDTHILTKEIPAKYMQESSVSNALGHHGEIKIGKPHELEFCSSLFLSTTNGTVLTRKPGRILAKTWTGTVKYGPKKSRDYACGVARCLAYDFGHIPFMSQICFNVMDMTDDLKHRSVRQSKMLLRERYKIHSSCVSLPVDETYVQLSERYDVSREEFQELTRWIKNNYNNLVTALDHPILNRIVAKDIGIPLASLLKRPDYKRVSTVFVDGTVSNKTKI
jgi:hypothetical protein